MTKTREGIAGGVLIFRRMILLLAVAAVMAALIVASGRPAFAAPNTTYTCISAVSDEVVAQGLSEGQAKQFETNNPETLCVRAEQLEVLTGQRVETLKKVPPGQQRKIAEEGRLAVLTGQQQIADGII